MSISDAGRVELTFREAYELWDQLGRQLFAIARREFAIVTDAPITPSAESA